MRGRIAALICALTLLLAGCAGSGDTYVREAEIKTPAEALSQLKAGNAAYLKNSKNPVELNEEIRTDTAENGQHPYAVVVTCSDSRVPAEHIFSAGIGDIFVIRTAGNVVDDIAIGSVAYGAEHLEAPLILVLGHTGCGAVAATLSGGAHGSIESITEEIAACLGGETDAGRCEILNVKNSMDKIASDELISHLLQEQKVQIVGAVYDIKTGEVNYLD